MSYGPARAGFGGNIVTFNSLNNNNGSFERSTEIYESPRERLLKVMGEFDANQLSPEEAIIFRGIGPEQPWLLTDKEIAFLEKLTQRAALLRILRTRKGK